MWHPTVQDILTAHEVVKEKSRVRTDGFRSSQGSGLDNIQDVLEEARQENDLYRAAAIYLQRLIEKHPFQDGNKRTAVMVADRFLEENNEVFQPHKVQETEEIYDVIKWDLNSMKTREIAHWLRTGELPDDNTA